VQRLTVHFGRWLGLAILYAPFATPSYGLEGKVVDDQTRQPLAGVYVIGAWHVTIPTPVESRSGCSKLEVVRTDAQGRFVLSRWSGNIIAHLFGDENLNVYYYFPKYRLAKMPEIDQAIVALTPDTRPPMEQLVRIGEPMAKSDCGSWTEQQVRALPMYRVMYEEARSIASSYEERQSLSGMLFMVERLELGENQAQDNASGRLNRGYK
jgi:hypothetical protein